MPLDIRIRFGRAIRRAREEQKINQEEAAERLCDSVARILSPKFSSK
jgi:transcriptional regulator with XRE-family HTH domain